MSAAYDPQAWQVLYAFVGGAATTLTGLLALALSINLRRILNTPIHRARSREALVTLLLLILLSILMLIPGQEQAILGIELIVLGLGSLVVATTLQHRTLSLLAVPLRRRWMARIVFLDSGSTCEVIGGFSLLLGYGGGLYWLVPTIFICLVWGLLASWQLIVMLPEEEKGRASDESSGLR
jgi:modulator of FtsH protease